MYVLVFVATVFTKFIHLATYPSICWLMYIHICVCMCIYLYIHKYFHECLSLLGCVSEFTCVFILVFMIEFTGTFLP